MDSKLIFVAVFLGAFSAVIADSWTPWYDRDNPSGTGDWESVGSLLTENPSTMCQKPVAIECQTTAGQPYTSTDDTVSCCPSAGLVCKQAENGNSCADYRVRFLCPDKWTQWFDRDNPSGTGDWENVPNLYSENPNTMCEKPSGIECRTTGGNSYRSTGQTLTCCAKEGLICKNADNTGLCSDYKVRFLCPDL
ncbi:cartilage intermediate layer protein 1-like [Anneissia japonica]|uniref:cartilage intermediate layer protein 1-like n=1 Tax=Anneissia japonica TaxID=1529436 RepID=UPI0014257168|nr:cartilage intermediate layer protein 1-like [Anneissia japonica]XP_033112709.1 cartilage intermediate layer protein 1-like [Anneissia japonica]XP_033112711.1 cartilage intermediate layer protein 1-like [Anneissia japonica]